MTPMSAVMTTLTTFSRWLSDRPASGSSPTMYQACNQVVVASSATVTHPAASIHRRVRRDQASRATSETPKIAVPRWRTSGSGY